MRSDHHVERAEPFTDSLELRPHGSVGICHRTVPREGSDIYQDIYPLICRVVRDFSQNTMIAEWGKPQPSLRFNSAPVPTLRCARQD
jgi:hypothetical protein